MSSISRASSNDAPGADSYPWVQPVCLLGVIAVVSLTYVVVAKQDGGAAKLESYPAVLSAVAVLAM